MYWKALLISLALSMAGCDFIPFSGGQLSGVLTPPPADWTDAAAADVIRLETQPTDPYSVNLWVIGKGPRLYIHAGANRATWVDHIEADPNVRVLINNALYELRAQRVTNQQEFDAFARDYETKYGHIPRNGQVDEAYLFRLQHRV